MMTMEEEDMEVEDVFVFDAHEVDLDYEFDAARFFDFCREETPTEARQAEHWFENAGSHPPSPFVANLAMREDIFLGNVNACPESRPLEGRSIVDGSNSSAPMGMTFSETVIDDKDLKKARGKISSSLPGEILTNVTKQPLHVTTGLTFSSKAISGSMKSRTKSSVPKGSTLMKPTASQLAKQNFPRQIVGSRFQKLHAQTNEGNMPISVGIENQAAKRQKLDGGCLRKVADLKQQATFLHKAPKKDDAVKENPAHVKLRLTIPREPELGTAQRAHRTRSKNYTEAEHGMGAARRFKARPLNRKILDAPSLPPPKRSTPRLPEFQEFHLKTSERAMQHTFASSSSSLHCNVSDKGLDMHRVISAPGNRNGDLTRQTTMNDSMNDEPDFSCNFKARPLNKKIFSSKGDIGVFRNNKQETTVPMEFHFHTEKKVQHNPPIELFSKLSLASELQPNIGSQLKLPRHTSIFQQCKDSKENISSSFPPEQKVRPSIFGGKQILRGSEDHISEASTLLSARRSLGIR